LVVCAVDGVPLSQIWRGIWVHLGELDKDIDPEHEAQPVPEEVYRDQHLGMTFLRQAASDMIRHHGAIHPDSACEFTIRLRAALRG
jgi:Zn-finger nucleic acid-binding protein